VNAAITFENVALALGGESIYDNVSFTVQPGDFVCILGPSGCGKSTALRIIGDLLKPDSGKVLVSGKPPAVAWSDIAFVFQSPRLVPWRDVLSNVLLGIQLRFGRSEARKQIEYGRRLLSMVRLSRAEGKYPLMLSGGERQRVAIARALAVKPSIMLMDEPFSALDPNTRRRMRGEIERIWKEAGITVVFVTHDIEEALVLANHIVLLSNKPTRVLDVISVDTPRPREFEGNAELLKLRRRLQDLFNSLETPAEEEEAVS
jgi:NitT/TauT family transport system ATP-binding protein